ncbi:MAG: adenylate/guanylate cyclase domain-containing protein [Armatimonadetes bacterium]|nr:adenylate/guanylate cyclase domain-containing protein [Armatimonadota bacterium]
MPDLSPACKVCGTPLSGVRAIPPRVLRGVRRNPKNPNICNICDLKAIKGEIAEITVLFADIRGFTDLTTTLGPMRTKEMLDEYFHAVSEILYGKDAVVDHFIGDAMMAFFNQPIKHDDHVAKAVDGARDILHAVTHLNGRWALPEPVGVGIGINTGFAAVGTVGSTDPKDYTAIGDVVNIAARLQGQAAAGEILVTEEAYRQVAAAFPGAPQRMLELKGVKKPVTAYNLH